MNSPLWDRWFKEEHDAHRLVAFAAYALEGYQPMPEEPDVDDGSSAEFD